MIRQGEGGSAASDGTLPYEDQTISVNEAITAIDTLVSLELVDLADAGGCEADEAFTREFMCMCEGIARAPAFGSPSLARLFDACDLAVLERALDWKREALVNLAQAVYDERVANHTDARNGPRGAAMAAHEGKGHALGGLISALEAEECALLALCGAHASSDIRVQYVTSERREVSSLLRALKGTYSTVCPLPGAAAG